MRAFWSVYSLVYEKKAEKSCVLGLDLKACKILDDVTFDIT